MTMKLLCLIEEGERKMNDIVRDIPELEKLMKRNGTEMQIIRKKCTKKRSAADTEEGLVSGYDDKEQSTENT